MSIDLGAAFLCVGGAKIWKPCPDRRFQVRFQVRASSQVQVQSCYVLFSAIKPFGLPVSPSCFVTIFFLLQTSVRAK